MWLTDRAMPFSRPLRQAQMDGLTKWIAGIPFVLQATLQPQAEIRRVHADEGVRPIGQQAVQQAAADAGEFAVILESVHIAMDRQLFRPGHQALKPSACILGPPMPKNSASGRWRLERPDQVAGEEVAGGLARHHGDAHNQDQRTMPRPESAMKSENCCNSGAEAAASAICAAGLVERQAVAIQRLVGPLDGGDAFCAKTPALEAFAVDAVGRGRVAGHRDKRRQILQQHRADATEAVRADADELMHAGETTEDRPVAHRHVAGQRRVVGEDRVVADHAVMGDMHVGHDPVVVADAGHAAIRGAGAEAAELADRVAVADLQAGRFGGVFLVLGLGADGAELEDPVVATDPVWPSTTTCGPIHVPVADLDVLADDRIGADLHAVGQTGAGWTMAVGWMLIA